jgi:ParB family chromosome partitioning protein
MSASGKERGLGRGLSALLGEQTASIEPETKGNIAQKLPIDMLQRNPEQPRRHFDEAEMANLLASVRKQGILQPILVRPISGTSKYQIVAGERRWRAAQSAGLHDIPVYIRELSDREVVEVALVENMQRSDLNPVEEAQGYRALMEQFHHTQQDVADAVGRSRSQVANIVRLLELPDAVQDLLIERKLSAGHARALIGAKNPLAMAEHVLSKDFSVRQTEKWVRDQAKAPETKGRSKVPAGHKTADTRALETQLAQSLGLHVDLQQKGQQSGVIRIEYQTLEQLDDLVRKLNTV